MKRKSFLKKATNSFVGRVLRRLLGEENGAVMMEYIVIALLIAAAAIVAVGVFGNMTSGMFATLTGYLTNQKETSDARLQTVQQDATNGAGTANQHVQTVNQQNAAVAGAGNW